MEYKDCDQKQLQSIKCGLLDRVNRFRDIVGKLQNIIINDKQRIELQLRIAKIEPLYDQFDEVVSRIETYYSYNDSRADFENTYFDSLATAKSILIKK